MKKILIALAFALGSLSAQSETAASASVTVGDITLPQRLAALPDDIFYADKAVARAHIDYTPGDEKTYYYDAKGNQSAEPVSGGYYRKILGKTADGRTVVQDYYQDNGQAQMAPFILRQDAAEDDFRNANADSTLITYTREGAVLIITPIHAGKPGRNHYYDAGRLVIQSALPEGASEADDPYPELRALAQTHGRMYYPNGRMLSITPRSASDEGLTAIYRADGTLLMTLEKNGTRKQTTFWSANGGSLIKTTPAYNQAAREVKSLAPLMSGIEELLQQLKKNYAP